MAKKPEFLRWVKCKQTGDVPAPRDSHTSCLVKDNIYIFGGQGSGEKDVFFNDIFQVKIIQMKTLKKITGKIAPAPVFEALWTKIRLKDSSAP